MEIRKSQTKKFYNICPRGQCYKTFYVRNLRILVRVFVAGKIFNPSLTSTLAYYKNS